MKHCFVWSGAKACQSILQTLKHAIKRTQYLFLAEGNTEVRNARRARRGYGLCGRGGRGHGTGGPERERGAGLSLGYTGTGGACTGIPSTVPRYSRYRYSGRKGIGRHKPLMVASLALMVGLLTVASLSRPCHVVVTSKD